MHGNMNVKSLAALIQILRNQIFRARGGNCAGFCFPAKWFVWTVESHDSVGRLCKAHNCTLTVVALFIYRIINAAHVITKLPAETS